MRTSLNLIQSCIKNSKMRIISTLFLLALISCQVNTNKYKEAIGDDESGNLKKKAYGLNRYIGLHLAQTGVPLKKRTPLMR